MDAAALTPLSLPSDHPGTSDAAYRARRAAIAEVERATAQGTSPRRWRTRRRRTTCGASSPPSWPAGTAPCAVAAYRQGAAALALPVDRVPQLREVSSRLADLTGWTITPVPGLVPTRTFYGSLADRRFCSTQYIRHHSVPFYTPEPDVVHELLGHACALADPRYAELYELAGAASLRCEGDDALEAFSRVFWFTLEFGVRVGGGPAARLRRGPPLVLRRDPGVPRRRGPTARPDRDGLHDYDITRYQPLLFAARSFGHAHEALAGFLSGWDDDAHARLVRDSA